MPLKLHDPRRTLFAPMRKVQGGERVSEDILEPLWGYVNRRAESRDCELE
jgi:hypothetical protein